MDGIVVLLALVLIGVLVGAVLGIIAFARVQDLAQRLEDLRQELQRVRRQGVPPTGVTPLAPARPVAPPPSPAAPPFGADQAAILRAVATEAVPGEPVAVVASAVAASAPVVVTAAPAAPAAPPVALPVANGATPVSATPSVAAPPPTATLPPLEVSPQAPPAVPHVVAPPPPLSPPVVRSPRPAPAAPARDFESIVGKRWLTWSGIALVFLAGVFFLKYAYDQDWLGRVISPPVRVVGIAGVALVMLVAGLRLLGRGMPALAHGLAGGGVALAYLAIYAGFSPTLLVVKEPLFSAGVAFLLMAAVSAAGIALAVRHDALALAVCALLGGLLTPILCSTGGGSRDGLFTYLLLLDLGVLGAAWWRRWRALDLLAFAGTVALYVGWYHTKVATGSAPWGMLAWLGVFHALFLVLPFAHHWRVRSVVTIERFGLALGNLAFTLAYAAVMLRVDHQLALALCCLALAAVYAGIGALTRRRVGEDLRVVHGFLGLGAMLLTLGLLYLLPVEAVATAWAVEAAVLLALGYRFDHRPTRLIAHVVLACAVARLGWKQVVPLALDQPGAWQGGGFIANGWLLALLVAPLGAAACAAVHGWLGRSAEDGRLRLGCWWAAGALLLLAGAGEIVRHHLVQPAAWTLFPPVSAIAAWWAAGALGFLAAAWRWSSPATAQLALVPAGAGAALAIAAFTMAWPGGMAVLNPRCLSALGALGAGACWLWATARGRDRLGDQVALQSPVLVIVQLAAVLVATLETCAWFARAEAPPGSDPHRTLCAVWGLAAILSTVAALALRCPLLAGVGLAPLGLALGGVATLYLRGGEPQTLAANGRFLIAVLAVAAFAFLRLPFPAQVWLATATQLLATAVVSAEVVRWSIDHFSSGEALRYGLWSVSLVWSLSALLGFVRWRRGAGAGAVWASSALAAGAALMALLGFAQGWHAALPFLNLRLLAPVLAITALAVGARALSVRALPGTSPSLFAWAAAGVLFIACSCEPAVWFRATVADPALAHRLATFSVTVVWLVLASVALTVGFRWRRRTVRFVALGLFGLTAAKLLLVDMSGVQQLYRILAFLLTGVVLLAASYVYHRLERRLAGEPGPQAQPEPPAAE